MQGKKPRPGEPTEEQVSGVMMDFEGVETNLLFWMTNAIEVLIEDMDRRFQQKGCLFNKERKQQFNRFLGCLRSAVVWYEKCFEQMLLEPIKSAEEFDSFRSDANEVIRLNLYYIDRCAKNYDNYVKIFQILKEMEGGQGIVNEENLKSFRPK